MRPERIMTVIYCIKYLLVGIVITTLTHPAQSQNTSSSPTPSNPLDVFNYDPKSLMEFLWSSVKPEYKNDTAVNNTMSSLISQISQSLNKSQPLSALINMVGGASRASQPDEFENRTAYFLTKLNNNQSVDTELVEALDTLMLQMGMSREERERISKIPLFSSLVSDISSQLISLNTELRMSSADWRSTSYPDISRLTDLLTAYNFTSTGYQLLRQSWMLIDDQMPTLNTLKQSMRDYVEMMEAGRVTATDAVDVLTSNITVLQTIAGIPVINTTMTILTESLMDRYHSVSKSAGSRWASLSTDDKIFAVIQSLNMTTIAGILRSTVNDTYSTYESQITPDLSAQCSSDLDQLMSALRRLGSDNSSMWALEMIDAWGKPPTGLLRGNLAWPGEMNECIRIRADRRTVKQDGTVITQKDSIIGAWSMVSLKLPINMASVPNMPQPMLKIGFCLPDSCGLQDLRNFWSRVELIGSNVTAMKRRAGYPGVVGAYKTDARFIIITIFFTLLIGTVLLCTLLDLCYLKRKEKRSSKYSDKSAQIALEKMYDTSGAINKGYLNDSSDPNTTGGASNGHVVKSDDVNLDKEKPSVASRLIRVFSLYETVPRLMDTTPKPNQLQGLDGIRFFSMTWVILGHVWSFSVQAAYPTNGLDAALQGRDGDWTFSGVVGGLFAVDSFFLLSGCLVGYLFLKALHKVKGQVSCRMMTLYYVHRYIRLLPLYVGVILVSVAYTKYVNFGVWAPNYEEGKAIPNFCETNWWRNLLYINNVYDAANSCEGETWYLANDMQFYVISPIILIPLYKLPKLGLSILGIIWAINIGVHGWISSTMTPSGLLGGDPEWFTREYIVPWCRIGPYLAGLLLGHILFKKYQVTSGVLRCIFWMISLGGITLNVYIQYDATKEEGITGSSWDLIDTATYNTLKRPTWGICLAWIVYACNTQSAGPIGDILNWSGWAPLSKLTYGAYLFHIMIMGIVYNNRFINSYQETWTLVQDNIGFVMLAYAAAFFFHLILEAPMLGLEKLALPSR